MKANEFGSVFLSAVSHFRSHVMPIVKRYERKKSCWSAWRGGDVKFRFNAIMSFSMFTCNLLKPCKLSCISLFLGVP